MTLISARPNTRRPHLNGRTGVVIGLGIALLGGLLWLLFEFASPARPSPIVHMGWEKNVLPGTVVRAPNGRFYLVRLADGSFVALSSTDPRYATSAGLFPVTRGACDVRVSSEVSNWGATKRFMEPCSGSFYDDAGHRIFGPSPRDMDRHPVSVGPNGRVTVDTRRLTCGQSPFDDYPTRYCEPPQ